MNKPTGNIAGIILAAGEGKRIGQNKALLKFQDKTFVELIVDSMAQCGCAPIIVVLGAEVQSIKASLKKSSIKFALNENWRLGQFTSVKTGLSQLPPKIPGVMVALVDHPVVQKETYHSLCDKFSDNLNEIVIPIYKGKRGHPVVIPETIFREILGSPDDISLKDIIRKHNDLVYEQMVDDPGILRDIDTQNDLRMIKKP
jgi:CTP:molybdopterin cytidylyltransferase MocA